MEVLVGLSPLDLVIQEEAKLAAHRLWSLGCWSYLHPQQEHSCILTRLQKSDPIFNMRVNIMKLVLGHYASQTGTDQRPQDSYG